MENVPRKLCAAAALALSQATFAAAQDVLLGANTTYPPSFTTTRKPVGSTVCKDGIIIPKWEPSTNISPGDTAARAIVYFLGLAYIFLGVSIIADRFMASIEVITSKEREIIVKRPNGEVMTVSVKVWNETVSNLTLMALGSSAPEILLSVFEIIGELAIFFFLSL